MPTCQRAATNSVAGGVFCCTARRPKTTYVVGTDARVQTAMVRLLPDRAREAIVRRIIEEELTDRQRQALILLGVQDMPREDAARKLKTNRNALYKLLHDARLRLRRRLSMEDITPNEVLTLFEQK